jgi:L-rhamnose isomerase
VVDDELKELSKEIIRNDADEKVIVALDYFDASINRLCAWVTGVRSMQKALLSAILQPYAEMKKLQDEGNFTKVFYMHERVKYLPFVDVWNEYLARQGRSEDWWEEVEKFENEVIAKRV